MSNVIQFRYPKTKQVVDNKKPLIIHDYHEYEILEDQKKTSSRINMMNDWD